MRATLYVLNCQEFTPLVEAAQRITGISIEEHGSYLRLSAPDRLRLEHRATGVTEAVWFAAPTGGIEGHITRFDAEVLEISADERD